MRDKLFPDFDANRFCVGGCKKRELVFWRWRSKMGLSQEEGGALASASRVSKTSSESELVDGLLAAAERALDRV